MEGCATKMGTVSDRIIFEIKVRAEEIDQLQYGEISIKIQDGKPIWGEIKRVWKADSNKREAQV